MQMENQGRQENVATAKPKMATMKKVKIITIIVVAILALVVISQNSETVESQFLFWSFEISRALLLFLTFLFGLIMGMLLITYMYRRKK